MRESYRRRSGAVAVAVVLIASCAGCALGAQGRPSAVDASPSAAPSRNIRGDPAVWTTRSVPVFLVHDERLLRVSRRVTVAPGEDPAIAALLTPVTDAEANEGLRSALPSPLVALDVSAEGRTARVELPKAFDGLAVADQILGVGQIVYTLTADGTVDQVQFSTGSRKVAVPNGAGRLVSGPVDRSDYAVIAPVRSSS
ncbi:MAG: GerMN domain-containing protein [Nocardioidaceae bacterium]